MARLTEWGSRRETESEKGEESLVIDPKPGELGMVRMKIR